LRRNESSPLRKQVSPLNNAVHWLVRLGLVLPLGFMATLSIAHDDAETLRAELAKGLAHGMPSISVAIATRQGVVWSTALGFADLPSRSRAHTGYLYGIGSITKMFVACAIEELVDEGTLSLDATAGDLLGASVVEGIPNAAQATVRELLDHTSGVPSWEFDRQWIRQGRGADMVIGHRWGKTEALEFLKSGRDPPTNAPGAGYGYSNSNYTLLGLILEKVTGHEARAGSAS
jgi:D-alanyl-D-alanine carboxypeptidase